MGGEEGSCSKHERRVINLDSLTKSMSRCLMHNHCNVSVVRKLLVSPVSSLNLSGITASLDISLSPLETYVYHMQGKIDSVLIYEMYFSKEKDK